MVFVLPYFVCISKLRVSLFRVSKLRIYLFRVSKLLCVPTSYFRTAYFPTLYLQTAYFVKIIHVVPGNVEARFQPTVEIDRSKLYFGWRRSHGRKQGEGG